MADATECCGCCFICCACFAMCGRVCLWIPCPGSRQRARELEEDELYAQQVAEEEILRQGQKPSQYAAGADHRSPFPQRQPPMVASRNMLPTQDADPRSYGQQPYNNLRYAPQHLSPGLPPDPSYQSQDPSHQYPPRQPQRESVMSGATLVQGSEEPGAYYSPQQNGQAPYDGSNHRPSRSGAYSAQELEAARRSEGTNESRRQPGGDVDHPQSSPNPYNRSNNPH